MKRLIALTAALVGPLVLVACSSAVPHVSADYPVFGSIEELTVASDVVVVATVGDVMGRQTEGARGGGIGNPMVFYRLDVGDVLKGSGDADLVLGYVDLAKLTMDNVSAVKAGQELLLFLRCIPDKQSPEIDVVGDFCIPLSADNGVFDVEGGVATARSDLVTSVAASQATAPVGVQPLEVDIDRIRETAATLAVIGAG